MAAGLGLLGLTPQAFWALTPRELEAALNGRLGPEVGLADLPTQSDIDALMRRFPDQG